MVTFVNLGVKRYSGTNGWERSPCNPMAVVVFFCELFFHSFMEWKWFSLEGLQDMVRSLWPFWIMPFLNALDINPHAVYEINTFEITATSREQWVNSHLHISCEVALNIHLPDFFHFATLNVNGVISLWLTFDGSVGTGVRVTKAISSVRNFFRVI